MSITFVASGAPPAASCVPGDACCRAIFKFRFSNVKAQTSGGHFEAGLSVSGD